MGIFNSSSENKAPNNNKPYNSLNPSNVKNTKENKQNVSNIKTTNTMKYQSYVKNNLQPQNKINTNLNILKNESENKNIIQNKEIKKSKLEKNSINKISKKAKPISNINSNIFQNNDDKITNNNTSKYINNNYESSLSKNKYHRNEEKYDDYNDDKYYDNKNKYYDEDDYYYDNNNYYDEGKEEEDYNEDYYSNKYHYYNNNQYNDNNHNYKKSNNLKFDNKHSFTQMIDDQINSYPKEEIDDKELNILMIAEKPSIAKTISKILAPGNLINLTKEKGWCYYSFKDKFKGVKANFVISAVSGHIYQVDFPDDYQSYNIDPYNLFDAPIEKIESNDDSYLNIEWLKDLAKNKDILCLWLDCDREGENICYEVIYNVLPIMNKKEYQQIYRAIFSSLSEKDISNSFKNISNYPDNYLSLSVDARQIIDLKVGISITRFLTSNLRDYLPKEAYKDCISYGPCQTPTLYFCVKREREIENKNYEFYKIYIKLKLKHNLIVDICLDDDFNENEVETILKKIKNLKYIKIKNIVSSEIRKKSHPLGLNTPNMLKISSLYLNNSPQTTMNLAQNLYMQGVITYPRTETTYYSPNFNFEETLINLGEEKLIYYVNENIDSINEGGYDAGDHPPITPLGLLYNQRLKEKENELYNLICNYYLASLSPDLEYNSVVYEFEINNKTYKSTNNVIKREGYIKYYDYDLKNFIDEDQQLEKNNIYEIIDVTTKKYVKDDYLSEAELIEEMEKNKIGTDASMSIHIENIVKRGYVQVTKDRRLIPTDLGRALIEALESVDEELVLPKNRAKIENFVSLLAKGEKSYENVLKEALKFYKEKYNNLYYGLDYIYDVFGRYFELYYENY